MLPDNLKKYFWDVKASDIDPVKKSSYVSERLLELGDFDALKWLIKTYGKEFLKKVVEESRNLSLKSANFYSIYFGIDPKQILCLSEDFRSRHKAIWNR